MSSIGCHDKPGSINWDLRGYTFVHSLDTIDTGGILSEWCVNIFSVMTSGHLKLKVFRYSGIDLVFVGESDLKNITYGANHVFSANISVEAGDVFGLYRSDDGSFLAGVEVVAGGHKKIGDITNDSLISTWTTQSYRLAVSVTVTTPTPTPPLVQSFYFTKNNLSNFDCKALSNDTTIRCEAIVTFSGADLGKRYWVNWIIRQPNGQDFAPYSEYAYVTSTVTFYMNKALSGLVAGTYTINSVTVSQG